jgi:hypothetical protein
LNELLGAGLLTANNVKEPVSQPVIHSLCPYICDIPLGPFLTNAALICHESVEHFIDLTVIVKGTGRTKLKEALVIARMGLVGERPVAGLPHWDFPTGLRYAAT